VALTPAGDALLHPLVAWAGWPDYWGRTRTVPRTQKDSMDESRPARPAIVVVEDQPELLNLLQRVLRDLTDAYDIITVSDPAAALEQIKRRDVPLVITDYHMPGMTGMELLMTIKVIAPQTQVILLTAYASPLLEQRALAAGAEAFVAKPFSLDGLEQLVRAALRPPQQDDG
jgi:two-component system, response regulator, stage 0 sporulation protein F